MGAALRAGGYRAPIVAVEHGALLALPSLASAQGCLQRLNFLAGAWADSTEVAVSDFMLERTCRHSHAQQIERIYNGIDSDRYLPDTTANIEHGAELVVGFAGRLISGKGADHLIRAVAHASQQRAVKVLIAGEGPERTRLTALARELGCESRVTMLGTVSDTPGFWRQCDVVVVPSDSFTESFSMVTLEAMSCGKAIVATRNGAIPELVLDGLTGTLVPAGDPMALARALITYAQSPDLRLAHGAAARARAVERFHIDACAQAYIALFSRLATDTERLGHHKRHMPQLREQL
jgi:glycosyltransferase involved in cell wall biosynthesis